MKASPTLDEGDVELLRWMRGTRLLAIRVTVVSFAFASIVAFVLVLAQQLLQTGEAVKGRFLGLSFDISPLAGPQFGLPLLVLALGAWILLSSLSRLIVARQVRDHLRGLASTPASDPGDDLDSGDDEAAEGGDTMAERILLESYLGVLANASRVAAITLVLSFLLPPIVIPGLLLSILVATAIAGRRYRQGRRQQGLLRTAARNWRREGTEESHHGLVDAIYGRDTSTQRLSLLQALGLLGVVLVTVILPVWFHSGASSGAGLVILLMWLQGLLLVDTEAAGLGWRWGHRMHLAATSTRGPAPSPRTRPGTRPGTPPGGPPVVAVLTAVPARWPANEVVWLRVGADAATIVLLPGPDAMAAGMPVRQVAQQMWRCGVDLIVLRDQPFAAGARGYAGLGDDLPTAVAGLARLVDLSTVVLLAAGDAVAPATEIAERAGVRRLVPLDAAVGAGAAAAVAPTLTPHSTQPTQRTPAVPPAPPAAPWTASGRIDRLLALWFDADRSDDDVADATRRLFEAAAATSPRT
jgi:hypothetical protein